MFEDIPFPESLSFGEDDFDTMFPKTSPLEDTDVNGACAFLYGDEFKLPMDYELEDVVEYVSIKEFCEFFKFVERTVTDYYWLIETLSEKEAYEFKDVVEFAKKVCMLNSIHETIGFRTEIQIFRYFSDKFKSEILYRQKRKKTIVIVILNYPNTKSYESIIVDWLESKHDTIFKQNFSDPASRIFELNRIRDDLLECESSKIPTRHDEIMIRLRPLINFNSDDKEVISIIKTITDMITEVANVETAHVAMTTKSAKF
jgi:hypothetical protein